MYLFIRLQKEQPSTESCKQKEIRSNAQERQKAVLCPETESPECRCLHVKAREMVETGMHKNGSEALWIRN